MGVLRSKLFTEGDAGTVKKLEDCATGRPNEVLSHFARGQKGEHIRKVQQALQNVQRSRPELGIPAFDVDGVYSPQFAKAIAVYKAKKDIRNYANKIDDIVGIKTIRSLDSDNTSRPHIEPPPRPNRPNVVPRPLPKCVPDADCPLSRQFDVTMLMGVSGGEIVEVAEFFFTIRDTTNGLSALYAFRGGGAGLGASPVTPAAGGSPSPLTTPEPVRVTRFGPVALLFGATSPPSVIPVPLSIAFLSLSFRPDGARGLPQTPIFKIDTGAISIPGINLHGAQFKILTLCNGQPGATRKVLGLTDIGPTG